jgi:hypothetical protein
LQEQNPDRAAEKHDQRPSAGIKEARDRLDWLENLRNARVITEAAYEREKARTLASVFPRRNESGPPKTAS